MSFFNLSKYSSLTFDYNPDMYQNGMDKYVEVVTQLDSLIEDFNTFTSNASDIENYNFKYDGVFLGVINNMKSSLINLRNKLQESKNAAVLGQKIASQIQSGEVNHSMGVLLLKSFFNLYRSKLKLTLGDVPLENIDYSEISNEGYTPQGMTIIGDKVLISAYYNSSKHNGEKKNAKIFVYDLKNNDNFYSVVLDYDAHVGGITFDETNRILLISGINGAVEVINFDALEGIGKEHGNEEIDLNDKYKYVRLNSNININYNSLDTGNTETDYSASTVYFDNETNKLYIGKFATNGKLISGDISYNSSTGTYDLVNPTTCEIDGAVQGISTYHTDDKTYLIESRSYSSNNSQITVRDITDGIDNSTLIGSKDLAKPYSEAIHVDDSGKAAILYEGANDTSTQTIDINEIIAENNKKLPKIGLGDNNGYDKGDPKTGGYDTYVK